MSAAPGLLRAMPAPPVPIDRGLADLQRAGASLGTRSHAELAALAEACGRAVAACADEWVAQSRAAKGWADLPVSAAEEWASGPVPVARFLRLVALRHRELANGPPPATALATAAGNRLTTVPVRALGDRVLLRGVRARLEYAAPAVVSAPPRRGGTALVLGAGNVTATPLLDVVDHVLLRGRAVVLKPSPQHERLLPIFARALAPLLDAGFVQLRAGDGALGAALAADAAVETVHLTGSVATAAALRADPRLAGKEFTAELGGCTPVLALPGTWRPRDLAAAARQLAAQVAWNGGATCTAPRVLVTARDWPQRAEFVRALEAAFAVLPARVPFHASAREHHARAAGRPAPDEALAPLLRAGLDPDRDAALLQQEHFAPVLLELPIAGDALVPWLDAAVAFVRERVAGALAAGVVAPPRVLGAHRAAVDAALARLPHGTVSINAWAGLGYGLGSTPWGVPPRAAREHGTGFARDLWCAGELERVVVEAPFDAWPAPPWFSGRAGAVPALRALVRHYAEPSLRHTAATVFHACR